MKKIIFYILYSSQIYIKHISSNKYFCNEKYVNNIGVPIKSCIVTDATEYASTNPGFLVSLLQDVKTGNVIQVNNNTTLELWPNTNSIKQKFLLKKDKEFFNILNSGKCVDFDFTKKIFYINVCNQTNEQKFKILTNEEYKKELNFFSKKLNK